MVYLSSCLFKCGRRVVCVCVGVGYVQATTIITAQTHTHIPMQDLMYMASRNSVSGLIIEVKAKASAAALTHTHTHKYTQVHR